MLDAGADPLRYLPTSPLTAMIRAVKNGHAGIVQLFMERGFAIPAWVTISGRSHPLLKMAADNGHLPVVQLIIGNEDGALPSPSHLGNIIGSAAERDHFSVVKALLEEFADLNWRKGVGQRHCAWQQARTKWRLFNILSNILSSLESV
ncbi:hypothetical protein SI65_02997 [Aspergillus cristatus]|uniref:Uncharacterized protein n=1 Tax=Aspergillus cristatus TaxID=573508 RepID=A0A1E3BMX9_ASPCR|nr:hypothetical protein SI65_02997 [Aspergillus cristatus]